MAIVFVRETFDRPGSQDVGPRTKNVRSFIVLTDSTSDNEETVRGAVDPSTAMTVPSRWQLHPDNGFLAVSRITSRPNRNQPLLHEVRVEYESQIPDPNEVPDDPLLEDPFVEWFFVPGTRPAVTGRWLGEVGADNAADPQVVISNSAGITFPEPMFMDDSRLGLRVTRNESVFPVTVALLFQDAINSDVFLTAAVGQAKVQNIRAVGPFTRNQITYLKITYEIHFRRDGWILEHRDEGKYQINAANPLQPGQPFHVPCTDGTGQPVIEAVPLNGSGNQAVLDPMLAPGSAGYNSQFIKLRFGVYNFQAFSALNLG